MRVSKQSIYLDIDFVTGSKLHLLSGEYKFHSLQNKTSAFIREGDKILNFNHPYYLSYDNEAWCLRDERFLKSSEMAKVGIWMKLFTKGCVLIVCLDHKSLI